MLEYFSIGVFFISAFFYIDMRFNNGKIITKVANKLF